jgi:hypothetical protein
MPTSERGTLTETKKQNFMGTGTGFITLVGGVHAD